MRKGDIIYPIDFLKFLSHYNNIVSKVSDTKISQKTSKFYERILRRSIVPKLLEEKGKLLWEITSVEEAYDIWKETKEKTHKAALGFFLKYIKKQNGLKEWTLDYYQHKKIWKLETPQILSNFKDFLSEKYFLMDLEARDDCVKKLMHILEIENISLPELAKNIETIIMYYLPGGSKSELLGEDYEAYKTAIIYFYDFMFFRPTISPPKIRKTIKQGSNLYIVKKNLDKWCKKVDCPYTKIITLYYEYCKNHNDRPPTRHQLEELCLQENLKKGIVRTYLCYLCKSGTQTGQFFIEQYRLPALRIRPDIKIFVDDFYKKVENIKEYMIKITASDPLQNTKI